MTSLWAIPGFLGDSSHFGTSLAEIPHAQMISPLEFAQHATLPAAARALAERARSSSTRPHLVGYSLGGRLALLAATLVPRAFASVTAISAHPGFAQQTEREARLAEDRQWAQLLQEDWPAFWSRWNERTSLANSPLPATRSLSLQERKAWASILLNWSTGAQGFLPELLADSTTPVQLVFGEADHTFVEHSRQFPAHLTRVFIPGAGHRVPLSAPQQLAERLRDFMRDHP